MKRLCLLLLVGCLLCALTSCMQKRGIDGIPAITYDYSKAIAGIRELHRQAYKKWSDEDLPVRYLSGEDPARLGRQFDPNLYFGVLKHVSMVNHSVLDYVYWYWHGNGRPFLYSRDSLAEPFKTYEDYEDALGGRKAVIQAEKAFLEKIKTDGSPESFFEFVVLYELAGQFHLMWHCYYDYARIVAAPEDVEELIATYDSSYEYFPFTRGQKRRMRRMDVRPRIRFPGEETVEVSIVTFSDWGGFTRKTYHIRRDFPHKMIDVESETLVEYDCGNVI